MKHEENKLFKTSEFAKVTGVSIRTLRHYNEIGLLKPSSINEKGYRLYSVDDYIKMQNIVTLKFLGFSLYEISVIMFKNGSLQSCLRVQYQVIQEKIKHFNYVAKAIKEAENTLESNNKEYWKVLNNVIRAVNMEKYYCDRAREYEVIYNRDDSVRQKEQEKIKRKIRELFTKKNVLEVACGTGYWTKIIAEVSSILIAVDISDETLIEARNKNIESEKVKLCIGDAYKLDSIEGEFNAACANFWISHVPKLKLQGFIEGLHKRVGSGSVVFMADNVYVPGIGGELVTKYGDEDTYKVRELLSGEKYEVLKNYYSEQELRNIFRKYTDNLHITVGSCFWWVWYIVK